MTTNLKQFWHFFMTTVTSAQSNLLEREKNKNKKRNYFSSSCFNLLRSTNVQSLLKQGKTRLKVCRGCQAFHSEASFSFSFIDHSFMLTRSISVRFLLCHFLDFYTAVKALVWNNGTLLCKIDFNRNISF